VGVVGVFHGFGALGGVDSVIVPLCATCRDYWNWFDVRFGCFLECSTLSLLVSGVGVEGLEAVLEGLF
jgi:hypothetical protein